MEKKLPVRGNRLRKFKRFKNETIRCRLAFSRYCYFGKAHNTDVTSFPFIVN